MSLGKKLFAGGLPPVENAFNVVTYTGDGASTKSITGVGFKPDMVWVKARSSAYSHNLQDSTRGGGTSNALNPNLTLAEGVYGIYGFVNTFDTDGFTVGTGSSNNVHVNNNGTTYVAWCWRANEGTTTSNTDGNITSTVQANQAAGFSIVKYSGNGGTGPIGHGLSQAPDVVLVKSLNATHEWQYFSKEGSTATYPSLNGRMALNNDGAANFDNYTVSVSSTTFEWTNSSSGFAYFCASGTDYIAYCFHNVNEYSSFGDYTGTGSSGNAQNIGFQPDFVMIKSKAQYNWNMYDTKRPSGSITGRYMLLANADDAEYTTSAVHIDITSTGFSFPNGYDGTNKSSQEYIYMAFKIVS